MFEMPGRRFLSNFNSDDKMDKIIVIDENQLITIIENAVGKFLKVEPQKVEPDNLSSSKDAVRFLCENGYEISLSLFNKSTAKGMIPCRVFTINGFYSAKRS